MIHDWLYVITAVKNFTYQVDFADKKKSSQIEVIFYEGFAKIVLFIGYIENKMLYNGSTKMTNEKREAKIHKHYNIII